MYNTKELIGAAALALATTLGLVSVKADTVVFAAFQGDDFGLIDLNTGAFSPFGNSGQPAPGHEIYPYLLQDKEITGPDQVWCADIAYIPMRFGFMYLVAIMDRGAGMCWPGA